MSGVRKEDKAMHEARKSAAAALPCKFRVNLLKDYPECCRKCFAKKLKWVTTNNH